MIHVRHSLSQLKALSPLFQKAVIAIGNFDGVHKGHARILSTAVRQARAREGVPVVLTFDPHPRAVVADGPPPCLTTWPQRLQKMRALGIRAVVSLAFDQIVAALTPEQFIQDVLVSSLGVVHVVVGQDFRFGRRAAGDVRLLKEWGDRLGYTVTTVAPVKRDDYVVSSSLVRQRLLQGDVLTAARLLGRPYAVIGTVVKGEGRGASLGFPTANVQSPAGLLLPAQGVYVAEARLLPPKESTAGGHFADERPGLPAVAIIGDKPTFGYGQTVLEVHLLDFNDSLWGRTLEVGFLDRLRDVTRFESVAQLQTQMHKDVDAVRQRLQARIAP